MYAVGTRQNLVFSQYVNYSLTVYYHIAEDSSLSMELLCLSESLFHLQLLKISNIF